MNKIDCPKRKIWNILGEVVQFDVFSVVIDAFFDVGLNRGDFREFI